MLVKITGSKEQNGKAKISFDVIDGGEVVESGEMLHLVAVGKVGLDYGSIDRHHVTHSDYLTDLAALTGAVITRRISETEAEVEIKE